MPPAAPESSTFVFDTTAWTSMTSQMSYMVMAQPVAHHAAVANLEGESSWDDVVVPDSSLSRGDYHEQDVRRPEATTSAAANGESCPPKRVKSNPSLATLRRCELKTPPLSERRSSHKVTATKSKSFIALSENKNSSNNNRNSRREILRKQSSFHSMPLHKESSFHFMSETISMCTIHPQVRMRSNRCPRCAAEELKKTRKKTKQAKKMAKKFGRKQESSFGSQDARTIDVGGGISSESNDGSMMDDMNFASATSHESASAVGLALNSSIEEEEDISIEEVSLDAKWADALREISKRLANAKLEEEEGGDDHSVEEENPDVPCKHKKKKPQHCLESLNELHQTIERATKSIGKFSVDSEGEEESDCDTMYSESSLARDTPYAVNKMFAESKGQPLEASLGGYSLHPRGYYSHHVRQSREDHLSQGLGAFATMSKFEGTNVTTGNRSCHSSGSESSVTLSVGSEYTMESYTTYNSLTAPSAGGGGGGARESRPKAAPPTVETANSNVTNVSPTCVMDSKALDESPEEDYNDYEEGSNYEEEETNYEDYNEDYHGSYGKEYTYEDESNYEGYSIEDYQGNYVDGEQKLPHYDMDEEEDPEVFENSFFMSVSKDYSEKKMAAPPSTALDSTAGVYDSSAGPEYARAQASLSTPDGSMPIAYAQHENTSNIEEEETQNWGSSLRFNNKQNEGQPISCQNDQVLVEDVTSDESEDEMQMPVKFTPAKKKVASSPSKPVQSSSLKSRQQSVPSSTSNQSQPSVSSSSSKAQPSFFSALVHNSRARSRSRSRARSRSRSKSRSRVAVEDVMEEESDNEEKPTLASAQAKYTVSASPSKTVPASSTIESQPSFFTALVQNSRSGSRPRSRARPRNRSKSATRPRNLDPRGDTKTLAGVKHERRVEKEHGVSEAPVPQETEPQEIQNPKPATQEPPQVVHQDYKSPHAFKPTPIVAPCYPSPERGLITHPHYKLGDLARDEDMIVFPKNEQSRHRRSRRRRRGKYDSSSSSSSVEDDKDAQSKSISANIPLAIGQLRHLDAAFVRRSDGQWTYALVADGDDTQIRFVVNAKGSTKSFPESLWKSSVRRIRVLTPRQGDRFAFNNGSKSNRKKRSIGRTRSFRSRGSKGSRRLVSPSPTRRNSGVLNLPPTIVEDREYNNPSKAYV